MLQTQEQYISWKDVIYTVMSDLYKHYILIESINGPNEPILLHGALSGIEPWVEILS